MNSINIRYGSDQRLPEAKFSQLWNYYYGSAITVRFKDQLIGPRARMEPIRGAVSGYRADMCVTSRGRSTKAIALIDNLDDIFAMQIPCEM